MNNALQQLVQQYTGLEANDEAALFGQLSDHIDHLLTHDFGGLVNIMYRVDVSEPLFRKAMSMGGSREVADNLAALLLDRLRTKAQWREKYKNI